MFRLRLKEVREERGLSQQALANAIGEVQSTVGSWESGRGYPRYNTLLKIADFFQVSLDYLMGRSDVRFVTEKENIDLHLTDHERTLVRAYRQVSPTERNIVCKILEIPPFQKKSHI